MKKCPTPNFLCWSKLLGVILHLLVTILNISFWNIAYYNSFQSVDKMVNARCIHDELKFAIKDQSPQVYDRLPSTTDSKTLFHKSVSTEKVFQNIVTGQHSGSSQTFSEAQTQSNQGFIEARLVAISEAYVQKTEVKRSSSNKKFSSSTSDFTMLSLLQNKSRISASHSIRTRRSDSSTVFLNRSSSSSVSITNEVSHNENLSSVDSSIKNSYQPLRLTAWYDLNHIAFANSSIEFERLKQGFDLANEILVKLFSVIPVKGNLLLKRVTACGSYWRDSTSPKSKQKCGRISEPYGGERCLDGFQIPDQHLASFSTYDRDGTEPNKVHYSKGEGVPNTDLVVYVRSENTKKCLDSNIVAYAASCQLDQFFRPIAGYANFCPNYLSSNNFDTEKFYLTVLHEFFHILGFSRSLFKNFQSCRFKASSASGVQSSDVLLELGSTSLVCDKRDRVVDYVDGWHRILTPSVVKEAARHFNCSQIGGPLASNVDDLLESSHWDSRFLHPSLMTSSIGVPHLTIVDRLTLALFNDTGWYKVNMSLASPMFWGKDAGCQFGSLQYCHSTDNPFFCTASDSENGCHYLHLDKGACRTSNLLDSCSIYQAESGDACIYPNIINDPRKGETFGSNSRCFVSNISNNDQHQQISTNRSKRSILDEEGRCYEMRCNDTNTLEIRVKGADWALCKSNERVDIPGYEGFIMCPSTALMCNDTIKKRVQFNTGSSVCVKITMSFPGLHDHIESLPSDQSQRSALDDFIKSLVSVVDPLINETNTSIEKLPQATKNFVFFDLKTSVSKSRSCPLAVKKLKNSVTNRSLFIDFAGKIFTASSLVSTYTLQPCAPSSGDLFEETFEHDSPRHPPTNASSGGKISAGIIAAAVVGAISISVLASVSLILYLKSIAPNVVSPSMGIGPEVSYQPNSRGSPPSVSESGSMGQIQFSMYSVD